MLLLNLNEKKWLRKKVQFIRAVRGYPHSTCLSCEIDFSTIASSASDPCGEKETTVIVIGNSDCLDEVFTFSLGAQNQVVFREFQQQSALASTKRV